MANNVNWSQNPSEYDVRYGRFEKHRFDGVNGPKIPHKYPEKGPMLYEVLEYYGDVTRVMNEKHKQMRSCTSNAHDDFVYPRETRGPPKQAPRELSREQMEQLYREQLERQQMLEKFAEENISDSTSGNIPRAPPPLPPLTSGQREEAWLRKVTERQTRRMRTAAGYHPDVNSGIRNLWDPDEQLQVSQERYGSVVCDTRDGLHSGRVALPSSSSGSGVINSTTSLCQAEEVVETETTIRDTSPAIVSVNSLLNKAFPHGHPALLSMQTWLGEEGYETVESMVALEGSDEETKRGRLQLLDFGFQSGWIEAIQNVLKNRRLNI